MVDYTIISLNDYRLGYKEKIRESMGFANEITDIKFVNGLQEDMRPWLNKYGIKSIWDNARFGEIGIWLSTLNICDYAYKHNKTIIAFEDDVLLEDFEYHYNLIIDQIPEDASAFSFIIPYNQIQDAKIEWVNRKLGLCSRYNDLAPVHNIGKPLICRAFQGYCLGAMMYTPQGAKDILDLVRITGMTMPVDCWIFEQGGDRELNVYSPKPDYPRFVEIEWYTQVESTIQRTSEARHEKIYYDYFGYPY